MYTDPLYEFPRKILLYQEFGLLSVLAGPPIPRLNSIPSDFPKIRQIGPILEEIGTCVRQRKRPSLSSVACPCDSRLQVRFQVDDRPLPVPVRELRVVALINQIQHDRTRTKIERNTIAYMQRRMAAKGELGQPAMFDATHANGRTRWISSYHFSIAPKAAFSDYRLQAIYVHNVVQLGVRRNHAQRLPMFAIPNSALFSDCSGARA